jgi:hypothetical protein
MYLALRVTGNLIWPILLHASTDPTIFLHGSYPVSNAFSLISTTGSFIVILAGIGLLIAFIVSERRRTRSRTVTTATA